MTHYALMEPSDCGVLMMIHQPIKESFRYVGMVNGMPCVNIIGDATLEKLFVDPWGTQEQ